MTTTEIRFGGHDASVIAGVGFRSRYELWLEKTGRISKSPIPEERAWLGHVLEEHICQRVADEYGFKIRHEQRLYRHKRHPFMVGRLDRLESKGRGFVEAKYTSMVDEWGESGSDEVPPYVAVQCAHYQAITGRKTAYVGVCLFGWQPEFRHYRVERDRELIAMLEAKELEFWGMIQADKAPPTHDPNLVRKRFPSHIDQHPLVASWETAAACEELALQKAQIKANKAKADALEAEIMTEMGECDSLVHPDDAHLLAVWRAHTRKDGKVIRPFRLKETTEG